MKLDKRLFRWSHAHTFVFAALVGLGVGGSSVWLPVAFVAGVTFSFVMGFYAGRIWRRGKAAAVAIVKHGEAVQRATLREKRGRARQAEARARDLEEIARGEKRRTARAKGLTQSEVAELQTGALMRGRL